MTLRAEIDRDEQLVLEYPARRPARASSRSSVSDKALSADAGADFVRARMRAPQPEPSEERRVVDFPPVPDDDNPAESEATDRRRAGFFGRRGLILALALPLLAAAAACGYLYWNY